MKPYREFYLCRVLCQMPRDVEFTEASRKVFEGVIPTISPGLRNFRHEDQAISQVGTHLRWDAGGAVGDDDYSALDPAASFLALTPR